MCQIVQIGVEIDQVTTITHVIVLKTVAVLKTVRIRHGTWVNMICHYASRSTSMRPSLAVLSKLVLGVEMMA